MTQLINDSGFVADDWQSGFAPQAANGPQDQGLEVGSDADPNAIPLNVPAIRVAFPSFSDGRGFTIARMLRLRGYEGRLRAFGHVIADQYAMARRSGFDEVEIPDDLARRQPEDQWIFRADWQAHDYQARLRG